MCSSDERKSTKTRQHDRDRWEESEIGINSIYTHSKKKNDERRKGKIINWLWLLCKLERCLNHRMGSGGGGGRVSLCALLYDGALSGKLLWLMSNGKAK